MDAGHNTHFKETLFRLVKSIPAEPHSNRRRSLLQLQLHMSLSTSSGGNAGEKEVLLEIDPSVKISTPLRVRGYGSCTTAEECGGAGGGGETAPNELDPMCLGRGRVDGIKLEDLLRNSKAPKQLRRFYEEQNQLIDSLLALHEPQPLDRPGGKETWKVKLAIRGTTVANVLLFCLELTATILAGSLTLLAITMDAFMDILSSSILFVVNWRASKARMEPWRYPVGPGRFQTAGVIVFGTLMATLSLQILLNAFQSLFTQPSKPELGPLVIACMAVALTAKCLLYALCRWVARGGRDASVVGVLAQDHRNDILITCTGLVLSLLGDHLHPLVDPIGAILIALLILHSWSGTVLKQCQLIVGVCTEGAFHKQVLYLAMTHDPAILQVDTCRVYHSGPKYFVEVDIVMDATSPLRLTHDVGESLQMKLESLAAVDRAFVHVDYETSHHPEHSQVAPYSPSIVTM